MTEKIIYCSDLIRELKRYIKENGDDRVILDKSTKENFGGNDSISRLVCVPDDDLADSGYFCYIVLKRGDWEGRNF